MAEEDDALRKLRAIRARIGGVLFYAAREVLHRHGRSKSTSSLGQLFRLGKGEDHARHFGLEYIRSKQTSYAQCEFFAF